MRSAMSRTNRRVDVRGTIPEGSFSFRDKPGSRSIPMRDVGLPEVVRISHVCQRHLVEQPDDHVHRDSLEIELCVKGRIHYSNDGRLYRLSAGSLFVSGAGVPHHIVALPKNLEHYGICVAIPRKGESFLLRRPSAFCARGRPSPPSASALAFRPSRTSLRSSAAL